MRKMITLMAVVALAACDSATGSDRQAQNTRAAEVKAPEHASFSGGGSHRTAVVSVRRRAGGSTPLSTARAVVADGGEVTLEIRSSTSAGFSLLTSGTLEETDAGTGEANHDFTVTPGNRYLIIAYPSASGVLDSNHASFIEITP